MSASIGLTKFPTASECDSSGSSLDPRRYTMLAGPSLCGNHIVQRNREGMASMKVIVSPGSPASLQGYRAVPGMRPLGRTNSWADRILRLRLRRNVTALGRQRSVEEMGRKKTSSSEVRTAALERGLSILTAFNRGRNTLSLAELAA